MAYIPALIIQQESSVFIDSATGVVGQTMLIPTPSSGGQVDSDYWATPVNGFGIVGTGFKYTPTTPGSLAKPHAQSFHVVRIIRDSKESTDWYALGNSTQYRNASEDVECCTSPPFIMPLASSLPVFAPCSVICNQNDAGLYFEVFAAPTPDTGTYTANGYYNDVALPQITGATVAALVTALNSNGTWAAIGTWTNPSGATLIVTQAAGDGTNTICAVFGLI